MLKEYSPIPLRHQSEVVKVLMQKGLDTLRAPAPLDLTNSTHLRESLAVFLDESNDLLPQVLPRFAKPGFCLNPENFLFSPPFLGNRGGSNTRGNFFVDGYQGFALGVRKLGSFGPSWLAAASLLPSFRDLRFYNSEIYYSPGFKELNSDEYQGPIIVQLQGISNWTYILPDGAADWRRKEAACEVLKTLHWEKLLVAQITEWATLIGFENVYILPSEYSVWRQVSMSERGKIRYDVTAKRMGFKRPKKGLWTLKLTK